MNDGESIDLLGHINSLADCKRYDLCNGIREPGSPGPNLRTPSPPPTPTMPPILAHRDAFLVRPSRPYPIAQCAIGQMFLDPLSVHGLGAKMVCPQCLRKLIIVEEVLAARAEEEVDTLADSE